MRSPFLWHGRSHPSPVRPKVELHDHTAHGSWRRYAKVTDRTDRPTGWEHCPFERKDLQAEASINTLPGSLWPSRASDEIIAPETPASIAGLVHGLLTMTRPPFA